MPLSPEAKLMSSWVLANAADTAITQIGAATGHSEFLHHTVNDVLLREGKFGEMAVAKIGLTVVFTGLYALAAKENGRWKWPIEKALKLCTWIVWGATLWNAAQVALPPITEHVVIPVMKKVLYGHY